MKTKFLKFLLFLPFMSYGEVTDTLKVSFTKTVVLVFDKPIVFDNVGTEDVIVQRNGNRYLLTASVDKKKFETNLVIETECGFYQYIVIFNPAPKKTFFSYTCDHALHKTVTETEADEEPSQVVTKAPTLTPKSEQKKTTNTQTKAKKNNENDMPTLCQKIESKESSIKSIGVVGNKMYWSLGDIYVKDDYLFFKCTAKNLSNIKYDIDFVKFVVRSSKGNLKQRSVQEEEMTPVFVLNGEKMAIDGKQSLTKIFVFKKFTIDDEKKLFVEQWETGGDRKLEFSITNKDILKVKEIN